jgi:tetratricopeptide (TPR) repeat protein
MADDSAPLLAVVAAPRRRAVGRRVAWTFLALSVVGGLGYGPVCSWRGEVLEAECREALRDEQWQRLEDVALRWTWWQAGKAAPWGYAAQAAHELGADERAAAYLDRVPDRDPKSTRLLMERSNLLFGPLNRPLEGAAVCERALNLTPPLSEAHRRLIFFYAYTLQRRKMVEQIKAAIQWECDMPETYLYLVGQDWISFSNGYEENTKWMRNARDEELFLVARAIFRGSSLDQPGDEAELATPDPAASEQPYHLQVLSQYLERFPHNLELRAFFLQKATREGDAERVAELLAGTPPEAERDARFWRFRGWLAESREDSAAAESAYRQALAANPYDFAASHQLAAVLRLRGGSAEIESLERVAQQGRQLRRQILTLPDVTKAPLPLLRTVAAYMRSCGQGEIAERLEFRLRVLQTLPGNASSSPTPSTLVPPSGSLPAAN